MTAFRAFSLMLIASIAHGQSSDSESADVRNPFARPATAVTPVANTRGRASQKKIRIPTLHAVLAAGQNSVANLDGKVIAIGEQHKGYRLLSVVEDAAIFRYNGNDVTLRLQSNAVLEREDVVEDKGRGSSNGRN